MLSPAAQAKLLELISPPENSKLYAIIDGASVPDFLYLAEDSKSQRECLFAGDLAPEVERAAPHLIELTPKHDLIKKWLEEGWGEHWGIMLHAPADQSFKVIRRHFRKFLRVQLPDKKHVLFRYYDPRVFRNYLPTCNQVESNTIFGPIIHYFAEGKDPNTLLRFRAGIDGAILQKLLLVEDVGTETKGKMST